MANNYIKDTLKDVLRHTHSLGIFEMVKINGTAEETAIETVDADKTVILKATTVNPVPDFVDATVGLSRMSVLDGYLKFPVLTVMMVLYRLLHKKGTMLKSVEVEFTSAEGTDAHYRFMLADVINQQLKDIKFKGAEFDVNIVPSAKNLKDLGYFNSVLGAFENTFSPRTEDGNLYFYIGGAGSDRTKVLVAEAVEGEITHEFYWPLDIVLRILRLGDNANIVLSINSKGLLQIIVDSGIGAYTYLLPAKN